VILCAGWRGGSRGFARRSASRIAAGLFGLPCGFVAVISDHGPGVRHEFRTAALDQIAGFTENALEKIENFAEPSFSINEFGNRVAQCWIRLNLPCGAERASRRLVLHCSGCHAIDDVPKRFGRQGPIFLSEVFTRAGRRAMRGRRAQCRRFKHTSR